MAQFKISLLLLTDVSEDNTSGFVATPLCDYISQDLTHISTEKKDDEDPKKKDSTYTHKGIDPRDLRNTQSGVLSYCYTYNEKISIHQNAQKDLSFSMDRRLLQHDEWVTNPYVAAIHVGSLIELQDKYNNTYLFVVNKIAYTFKEHNITYNYTCKDAFSYQYTRQQSGFSIENDASSDTFIGAKTVDWWVVNKIKDGCHVEYDYAPIGQGLYKDSTGVHLFTEADRAGWDDDTTRIIVKEPFTSIDLNGEDEYQTTIIFSCSNSNANAALISLGDNLDLMLHSYESRVQSSNTVRYHKWFWFEPKKNQDVTGLSYSPQSNVSNFSLNFAGDNLTTILNVNSHELGDELITLLPSAPAFFTSLFMSDDWEKSVYYPGYFQNIVYGTKYRYVYNAKSSFKNIRVGNNTKTCQSSEKGNFVVIQLFNDDNKFKLSPLYNRFRTFDDNTYTSINLHLNDQVDDTRFFSKNNTMYLIVGTEIDDDKIKADYIIAEHEEIPQSLLGTKVNLYLGIHTNNAYSFNNLQIYFTMYRNFTEEEKEFAEIADQCPWLENRLIDFSYFVKQGIISKQEYTFLLSKLQNELRIKNGKLLYFTDSYNKAIKDKVQQISALERNLDALGAAFESDVIAPVKKGGKPTSLVSFQSAYDTTFNINSEPLSILNYHDLLSDTFNKYFAAEQRYLRNMYSFRKYFEEPASFYDQSDACIWEDRISNNIASLLSGTATTYRIVTFGNLTFDSITNATENNWIVRVNGDGSYESDVVVNSYNYPNFYIPEINANTLVNLSDNTLEKYNYDYNSNNKYYIPLDKFKTIFGYDYTRTIEIYNNIKYARLLTNELKKLILAKHASASQLEYYIRDTEVYTPFNNVRFKPVDVAGFTWYALPNILNYIDEEAGINKNYQSITWNRTNFAFAWNYYTSFFPLSEIYYKGKEISYTQGYDTTTKKTTWTFNVGTEDKYQRIPFIGNGLLLQDWGPCTNTEAQKAKDALETSWKYYSLSYNRAAQQVLHFAGMSLAIPILGSAIAGVWGLVNACTENDEWCDWTKNARAFRAFESWDNSTVHPTNLQYKMSKDMFSQQNWSNPSVITNKGYKFDSYFGNYTTSASASESYQQLTQAWTLANWPNAAPTLDGWNLKWVKNKYASFKKNNTASRSDTSSHKQLEYFNFYKFLAATYSFRYGDTNNNLYVKNKYIRILSKNDIMNTKDTYIRIPLYETAQATFQEATHSPFYLEDENSTEVPVYQYVYPVFTQQEDFESAITMAPGYLSALSYYPLVQLGEHFDLSNTDTDKTFTCTLQEALTKATVSIPITGSWKFLSGDDRCYIVKDTSTDHPFLGYYCIAHVEDYDTRYISSTEITSPESKLTQNPMSSDFKSVPTIYSCKTDLPVNVLKDIGIFSAIQTLTTYNTNLYMIAMEDESMRHATSQEAEHKNTCYWYKKFGDNNYVRVYTLTQLQSATESYVYCTPDEAQKYRTLNSNVAKFTNFSKNVSEFELNCYLTTFTKKDGYWSIESKPYNAATQKVTVSKVFSGDTATGSLTNFTIKDPDNDDKTSNTYSTSLTYSGELISPLRGLSNGMFWYLYHTATNYPTVFGHAAAIETQLQTYWNQAYNASKYCRFFLPEFWQPYDGSVTNAFSSDILVMDVNGNAQLSTKYVPKVSIYSNPSLEHEKYSHYLPKYTWTHRTNTSDAVACADLIKQLQADPNEQLASQVEVLNNPAVKDILNTLNTNTNEWTVAENGYMVYYCHDAGGTLWADLAKNLCAASTFDRLDGWYAMKYYLITQLYVDRPMTEYNTLKTERDDVWKKIYDKYPFILLEGNYSYKNATNSTELMKMAQLVFKGNIEPERGYTVSLIDTHSLYGYIGQELKPGQGILLKSDEYYDENDDIARALRQYLFITDVSYDLRSDANINITVNAIKYQEKMLQSLVKLIQ